MSRNPRKSAPPPTTTAKSVTFTPACQKCGSYVAAGQQFCGACSPESLQQPVLGRIDTAPKVEPTIANSTWGGTPSV